MKRKPGRPARRIVDRDAILDATLTLVETNGADALTMRALARKLRIDPMALYHYFANRDSLLAAAAAHAYGQLEVELRGTWRQQLRTLADAYLALLAPAGELLRYLTRHAEASRIPTERVRVLFDAAVAPLELSPRLRGTCHDAFIDLIHGISLSGHSAGIRPELDVLLAGIDALASKR